MVTRGKSEIEVNAYLAGIVDGEGHITINRSKTCPQRRKHPRYQAEVTIVNTDIRLMEYLVQHVGGSFRKRTKSKDWHKDTYQWKVTSTSARDFCEAIIPYLVIKRDSAMCIVRLYQECDFKSRAALSEEEVNTRERFYKEIMALTDSRRPQRLTEEDLVFDENQVCDSLNPTET